jgi:peptide deformylase
MTPNLRALIEDMVETMRHANGVGLAAPQVGVLKRLVVIECEEGELHVLINPEIIARDGEQTGYEGCLSVPGKTGIVTRPNHVKVKALNENMEPVTVEGEELLARALCHELDHLDGHLYTEMAEELYTNEELEAMQAEEDEDEA